MHKLCLYRSTAPLSRRSGIHTGRGRGLREIAQTGFVPLLALVVFGACGPRGGGSGIELGTRNGKIYVLVHALPDTVMVSTSHVLAQERIALRRYEPESGYAESGFLDIARYSSFDPEIWDDTERLIKLRFYASVRDSTTLFECEPLYNPYEVVTEEIDNARLRQVPAGHPGFDVAAALTRRIAAHAEGKAVTAP